MPDVVLRCGQLVEGLNSKTIVDELKPGDVFIKGANAVNWERGQSALLIGHPTGGTIGAAIGTLVARRVALLVPAGLEKNIPNDLDELAALVAAAHPAVPRAVPALWPIPGELFTEIEAIELLTGCEATPIAAGGVAGAEGAVRLLLEGNDDQVASARTLIDGLLGEPPFIG
jgi:hypothetical protein